MQRSIAFDPALPVTQKREDIARAIREHPLVIVCGETGSGKTTQLPKILLEMGRGAEKMIGHTQDRRALGRGAHRGRAEGRARHARRLQGALHRQGRPPDAHQADDRRHPARRDAGRTSTSSSAT